MYRSILPLLIMLIVSGCSTITPAISQYSLLTEQTLQPMGGKPSEKSLTVASSKPIPSLWGKDLIYVRPNGETGHYLYTRWSDTPSSMIQRSLLLALQDAAIFSSSAPSLSLSRSDWLLESELNAFEHRFYANRSEGFIDITYRVVDTQSKRPLASKRFKITAEAPSMDAVGGVEALRNAQYELNRQCLAWLTTLIKENQ